MAQLGLRPAAPVAIKLPNRPEALIAMHAAWRAGHPVVPVLPTYGPRELQFVLAASGAEALVVDVHDGDALRADLSRMGPIDRLASIVTVAGAQPTGASPWSRLVEQTPLESPPVADDGAMCALLFTSGSTGTSKAVVHTHRTLLARAREGIPGCDEGEMVELAVMPAGHIGGVLRAIRTFALPTRTVFLHPWDPDTTLRLVESEGITSMSLTPFFLRALVERQQVHPRDTATLRHVLVGGANVHASDVEAAQALGWRVVRSYGSTEHPMAFVSHVTDPIEERATDDGRAACGAEVRVTEPAGRDVAAGVPGEILLRGQAQCVGYLDPTQTADAFDADGWFRTGDLGIVDRRGALTVTGRVKDLIIRGGENISAVEVENVMATDRRIADVAVVGYPDDRYGERVCAFVVLRDTTCAYDLDDVRAHFVVAAVDRRKTPERVEIVDVLPRTANGKVAKQVLRARLDES
jgi:cyclohexanecarboxylate-CoA ligase